MSQRAKSRKAIAISQCHICSTDLAELYANATRDMTNASPHWSKAAIANIRLRWMRHGIHCSRQVEDDDTISDSYRPFGIQSPLMVWVYRPSEQDRAIGHLLLIHEFIRLRG